jgi:hypothetical protein
VKKADTEPYGDAEGDERPPLKQPRAVVINEAATEVIGEIVSIVSDSPMALLPPSIIAEKLRDRGLKSESEVAQGESLVRAALKSREMLGDMGGEEYILGFGDAGL